MLRRLRADLHRYKMQPLNENTINVPAFLNKLWKMVNDPRTDHLISWGLNGNTFFIQNRAQFWYELLPVYYKHNNMSSFIRQLNMYGFHKIASVETADGEKDELRFFHPNFQKDKPDLLKNIKRKVTTSAHKVVETMPVKESSISRDEIEKYLVDVTQIKGRQQSVDSQLSAMKQENAVLWRELALLRQKHLQQQQIVNKLIQFLVTLVQPARMGGLPPKRHYPLMINESPTIKKAKSSSSTKSDASDGPIIHEVENSELQHEDLFQETMEPNVRSPDFNRDIDVLLADSDLPEEMSVDLEGENASENNEDPLEIDGKVFMNSSSQNMLLTNLMNGNYNTKSLSDVSKASTSATAKESSVEESSAKDKTVATRDKIRLHRLNSVEDMDIHLENTQSELDSLKDILNPFMNGMQSVDANAFLGLFADELPSYGLSYTPEDLPKTDSLVCGSELTTYDPNLDFSQLFDEDSSDPLPIAEDAAETLDETGSITTPQIIASPPSFPKTQN